MASYLKSRDLHFKLATSNPGTCGPCQQFAPTFATAAAKLEPKVRFIKVDTESAQPLALRYNIRSIPPLLIIKDGQEVARQAGTMPGQMFEQWLAQFT